MNDTTVLTALLQITVLVLVWVLILLDAKNRSYKKRGLYVDRKQDKINSLNLEIRQLITGSKLEKAHIKAKYKLQYDVEDQCWYGTTNTGSYTGIFSLTSKTKQTKS